MEPTNREVVLEGQVQELTAENLRLRHAAKSRLKCPNGHAPVDSRGACWFCDAEANAATVARLERELSDLTAQIDGHRCGDARNFAKTMQVAIVDGEGRVR